MAALGSLPPWVQISPQDYLRATQAGAQMGHIISESTQRAWEEQERMKMAQERQQQVAAQQAIENAMNRLAQDRLEAYRQQEIANRNRELGIQEKRLGSLDIAQQRADELARHNQAMEEARLTGRPEAAIVNLPDAPGFTFLKNPSGALTPLVRPVRAQSELERARLELSGLNAMAPKGGEDESSAAYQARTNAVGKIMQTLRGNSILDVAPSDKRLRKPGMAYKTAKGVFKWTGTGWVPLTNSPQPLLSVPADEGADNAE